MPHVLGEGLTEGMAVAFSQSPSVKEGTPMIHVNYMKAVHYQHVSSLGGIELSAVQKQVPISPQRGVMQLGVCSPAEDLEPTVE